MQIGSSTSAYSSAALSQMHSKLFSSIDADGDGKMTLEELESSQASSKSGKTQSSSAADRFSVMDTDGDGSVTEDEGLAFFTSSMSSGTMGGMLQAQEAGQQEGTRPSGPPPAGGGGGGQAPQTFDELDTNQDGTVSLDEMLASSESEDSADTSMIEELFSHMDADGDGSVTEDEKTAFDEAMKANGPPKGPPPQMTSEVTSATTTEAATSTNDETASKIANLTAQWMTSVYQALSEGTKQTSTTSVAA